MLGSTFERAPDSQPTGTVAVDDMRRIAYEIVLRACGFGSLTIFCIMIGLSFDPRDRLPVRRRSDHGDDR